MKFPVNTDDTMGSKLKGCGGCFLFIFTTLMVYKLSLPVFMESFDPEGDTPSDNRAVSKAERTYQGRQLLCHRFEGSLGDILFQYASLLGMTKDQNRIFMASGDLSLRKALKEVEFRTGRSHCKGVVRLTERACCHFDDNLVQLDYKKNYEIRGYLQSWRYFRGMEAFLHSRLALKHEYTEKAGQLIKKHEGDKKDAVRIGVFVDTGTLNAALFKTFGYRIPPAGYFHRAMKHFRDKFKDNVIFYVVSDDRYFVWKYLKSSKDTVILEHQSSEVHLAVMGLMQHCIISIGPLSWWAGFFTEGEVVYYRDFFSDESGMLYNKDKLMSDYVYPGWIGMV